MPTRTTSSGAPKKARWTSAQKAAARKSTVASPASRAARRDRPARDDRPSRTDRPRRDDRDARFDRPRQNDRADRPGRDDRDNRPRRDERFDRPRRDDQRNDRFDRPRRDERFDRPRRDDQRDDRYDRPRRDERFDRPRRDERFDRPQRDDRRDDRYDRPRRDDRYDSPRRDDRRTERTERTDRADRTDRAGRTDRTDAPWRSNDRRDHAYGQPSVRPHRARPHVPDRTETGFDPEAERLAADHWTKATRRSSAEPATVAADNGFAALGLPDLLVERLARDGIVDPFPIQAATIPDALAGRDVLGRGRTGSGKTLAFGLPTLTRLAAQRDEQGRVPPRRPRALVLVPTRELAMQVSDALEPLVHVLGLRHKLVAGGLSYTTQIAALDRGVDLLIATPGRLVDLVERGAADLSAVGIAILDEADHMAEMGFLPEVTQLLDLLPDGGQRLLFSATLDRGVDGLVERYLTDPVTHSTDDAVAAVTTMDHHVLLVDPQDKKVVTAELSGRTGRILVFVRTKLGADRVAQQLREQGVFAAALHGGLSQGVRNRVLGGFRDGTLPVLVATDVAARGIHVDDVSLVLQVDPPGDVKDYLHRAGRTARAGEKGTVVTLALPHQRRTMERQLRDAGVDTSPVRVRPDDAQIRAVGGRVPSGEPVDEGAYRRLIEGERRPRRAPSRPSRPGREPGRPHTRHTGSTARSASRRPVRD